MDLASVGPPSPTSKAAPDRPPELKLADKGTVGENFPAVVVGIGLNVNATAEQIPPQLQDRATSLRLVTGRSWDRGRLLFALVDEMDRMVTKLEQGEFPAILAAWQKRDALSGRELKWLTPAKKVICGIALGPDAHGILHIRDRQGRIHQVMSGDLDVE